MSRASIEIRALRLLLGLFIVGLFMAANPRCVAALEPPNVNGLGVALVDVRTGQVLYERDGDRVLAVASTTKIMTALLAVERCSLKEIVMVPTEAAAVHGSRIYLEAGETYTMEELLYALMIASANDAAISIAHHISGSVDAFARLMTERARELGLEGFAFKNPHGLDQDGHVGSALDLARLSAYALRNPLFRRFSEATHATMPYPVKQSVREINTHNYFLTSYPGATGVKTGWTDRAGYCLVSSAKDEGQEVVGVILGAENRGVLWSDMSALISYGLEGFDVVEVVQAGTSIDLSKETGLDGLMAVAREPVLTVRPVGGEAPASSRVEIAADEVSAPLDEGDTVGRLEVYEGDVMVGQTVLVSLVSIPGKRNVASFWRRGPWFALVAAIAFGVYRSGYRRRRLTRIAVSRSSLGYATWARKACRRPRRPRRYATRRYQG